MISLDSIVARLTIDLESLALTPLTPYIILILILIL